MKKFATAINCIDGRVQLSVIKYITKKYGVKYVDMVTSPGPNKTLSDNSNKTVIKSIKTSVSISVEKHHSQLIAICGHHDCAGNPVDDDTHKAEIKNSVKLIESWDFDAKVIGLWIGDNWWVDEVE